MRLSFKDIKAQAPLASAYVCPGTLTSIFTSMNIDKVVLKNYTYNDSHEVIYDVWCLL